MDQVGGWWVNRRCSYHSRTLSSMHRILSLSSDAHAPLTRQCVASEHFTSQIGSIELAIENPILYILENKG